MDGNGKELKFNQLITKINIGKFTIFESTQRILFLSKGILIAHKEAIYFYEYKRYSRTLIMLINQKDRKNFRFSKLLNDKFCIYSPWETKIYQFNNEDFSITHLKTINVNLRKLIEVDDNVFINITDNYFYIWKKLKSIFKWDQKSFIVLILILNIANTHWLKNVGKFLVYLINLLMTFIIFIISRLYGYLLNPYKRIKNGLVYHLEKCGKNICCLKSRDYAGIYDYKNFKILKKINFNNGTPFFTAFFILNEKIIIFTDQTNQNIKIYDLHLNQVINDFINEFVINYNNTFKIDKNIYISIFGTKLIKWRFNFQLNNIDILCRSNFVCEDNSTIMKNIINNKLFIFTEKLKPNDDYTLSLFIYS